VELRGRHHPLVFLLLLQVHPWAAMQPRPTTRWRRFPGVSARYVYAALGHRLHAAASRTLLGNINGLNISVGYLGCWCCPWSAAASTRARPILAIIIGCCRTSAAYLDRYFRG